MLKLVKWNTPPIARVVRSTRGKSTRWHGRRVAERSEDMALATIFPLTLLPCKFNF